MVPPACARVAFPTVLGGIILVLVLLVFPVVVAMSGAIAAAILGKSLKDDAEQVHAGSELIELNR